MSNELQAAESEVQPDIPTDTTDQTVTSDEGSDSASQGVNPPQAKITFSDEQASHIDKIFGKKTHQLRQTERENEQLQRELNEMRGQLPKEARPEVPEIPDRYDFDTDEQFNSVISKRDEVIQAVATFDARQAAIAEQQQQQQNYSRREQEKAFDDTVKTYSDRARKFGINADKLQLAGQTVGQYGLNSQIVEHILRDDQGPLITTYLADNPLVLDEILGLDMLSAAIAIDTQIKPKAAGMRPKTTSAPEPLQSLRGAGVPFKERGPPGATFE